MKVGSLFSGGGLGDFGFMAAGFEIAWQCEIDDYCQKILALRYPESKKYRDIKTLKGDELERVDVITGGFPCQPFSTAGKRRGTDDNRHLWPEMFRIIRECRPRWVIADGIIFTTSQSQKASFVG
jgi:DNA (cytosine-5)-methyltransferase 1